MIHWLRSMVWPAFFKMESFKCYLIKSFQFKDRKEKLRLF